MDEEANFAKLLSQSTTAAAPSWNAPSASDDPWANPFSDTPTSNPFASPYPNENAFSSDPYTASSAAPSESPVESPYVSKIEQEALRPDMPSVIAAREQAAYDAPMSSTFPIESEPDSQQDQQQHHSSSALPLPPKKKDLPSDLIDEDLMAASDPSASLKKAFVKSSAPVKKDTPKPADVSKAYVFSPTKSSAKAAAARDTNGENQAPGSGSAPTDDQADKTTVEAKQPVDQSATSEATPTKAKSIPLPDSVAPTPTATRPTSPQPAEPEPEQSTSPAPAQTPTVDRVAVSPLDQTPAESDYGFQSLSIGAASIAPPLPAKSPVKDGWASSQETPASRFGGKGWGAMDDDDDGGLFGKGGPSIRAEQTPWETSETGGWGEPGLSSVTSTSSSTPAHEPSSSSPVTPSQEVSTPITSPSKSGAAPRTPKLLSKPLFQINVGDPTRVGDPVRGYTVYTVKTRTTSPHYRRGEFSVLRRFSDFLWLFETLTMNNPGVIVPPVPDKHPFGRFQDTFIETRRLALERCLTKITAHPVLQLDPDLRLFLESDHFAAESKSRRAESAQENKGLLSAWTGPKFVEQDDWFDSRRSFLDSLESQLKALSKSIETASKTRLDMATAMGDFSTSMTLLSDSDLGSAMCAALARLADLAHREKEANEEQAKAEVVHLLNLSDEYVRFIGSVRLAFASRIKCYEKWQAAEKEVGRVRTAREKARQQGKLSDRGSGLAEIGEAERRSRDANLEFDSVSKLVKSEFARFEKERVEEFKRILERYLDGMIVRQKELIGAWEEYHGVLLKMAQK